MAPSEGKDRAWCLLWNAPYHIWRMHLTDFGINLCFLVSIISVVHFPPVG